MLFGLLIPPNPPRDIGSTEQCIPISLLSDLGNVVP